MEASLEVFDILKGGLDGTFAYAFLVVVKPIVTEPWSIDDLEWTLLIPNFNEELLFLWPACEGFKVGALLEL